ncbi:MAG: paraquat-inducible protein A [Gammaproteobacteria bacterium]|nr:paraquat-inducible protein A [Gammaproteobacteria bacterium]
MLLLSFITVLLFVSGLFLPMMTLTKLLIFEDTISVASGVYTLFSKGHYLLFLLVAGFSIVLPMIKLLLLFKILLHNQIKNKHQEKLLRLMHDYGRWGMLDVYVVAVLIVTVKLEAIASIELHSGLYVFGLSVLLIMLITHLVNKQYEQINENKL